MQLPFLLLIAIKTVIFQVLIPQTSQLEEQQWVDKDSSTEIIIFNILW